MNIKLSFALLLFFGVINGHAQLTDDFSDGDFSNAPTWQGETNLWQVNAANELQSMGNAATDTLYLSTPNVSMTNTEWRFSVRYTSAPSGSNYIKIYLVSDQADLEGLLNGYYIRLGESGSNDGIDLYEQSTSGNPTRLIDGTAGTLASGIDVDIKVTRDAAANWEVLADFTGSGTYTSQGTANDNTHSTTAYFGVWAKHTSTRRDSFYFDNFFISPPPPDLTAPDITSVNPLTDRELELSFSEVVEKSSAENIANYELLPGMITPSSAQRLAADSSKVLLTFANAFANNTDFKLLTSNVEDKAGNAISPTDTFDFYYFVADVAVAGDVVFNEIFADPTPAQQLPEAEFLELFNSSDTKIFQLEDWTIDNGTTTGNLPFHILEPKAYLILTKSTDTSKFQIFGEVVAPSAWTALTNGGDNMGLRSASGTLIDTVDYSSGWYGDDLKKDGGWTLERINPNASNCPAFGNWRASEDVTGGTPGRENSIFSEAPDTDAPQIASIILQSPTELLVCFNEAMDVPNLENVSHFSVGNGLGNPATATALSPDNQCVILTWATAFPQGKEYTLTVSGVEDCSGNTLVSSATINFIVGKDAQPFEVVMNELFFDPSPSNGLPESEFVELYNRTSEILDLNGWQFSDGGSPAVIKNAQLLPNEYAILCHQDDSLDWAAFGKVIAVESFPGLNNSGDSLWLRNAQGDLMDFVFYSSKWHENAEKAAGGWTLERIDPDFVNCNHERNWWSSQNLGLGGTPGAVNSVNAEFTDLKTPKLQGIRVVASANQVVLTFSESLDAGFSTDENNYDIQPAIGNPLVALSDFPETNKISLLLGAALDPDILYTLTISNLQDCAGNVFSGKFRFGIPKSPTEGDVLINEILFNAHTGGSDFLEIYNASNKVLRLSDLYVGAIFEGTDSIVSSTAITPLKSQQLVPGKLLCLSKDIAFQIAQYSPPDSALFLRMPKLPSFPDSKGEAVVFYIDQTIFLPVILDRFAYDANDHFPSLADKNGVSLERLSLKRSAQDPSNWHSAASTVKFATPGYANSQRVELSGGEDKLTLQNPTFSPDGDAHDDVLIINYDFSGIGGNALVSIYDTHGRKIKNLRQNMLLGPGEGTVFWDGTDEFGHTADMGMYVVLFEVSLSSGKREVHRAVCVLAKRL